MKRIQVKCVAKSKIDKTIVTFVLETSQEYEWGKHGGCSNPENDQHVYTISIEAPEADKEDVKQFTKALREKRKKEKVFKGIKFTVQLLT